VIIKKSLLIVQILSWATPALALAAGQNIYANQNYAYKIAVPSNITIETDPPPSPQHGFAVTLGKGRSISVDASYDSTFLGSVEAAIRGRADDDGIPSQIKPVTCNIGGLAGERIHAEVNGQKIDLAVAYRPNGQNIAIIYTFELDTGNESDSEDERLFQEILSNFSLTPLPN